MATHESMVKQAKDAIITCLQDGYAGYYSELHDEVFNTDYYIIGYSIAIDALEEYGVFDAIKLVMEYEQDRFGEVITSLYDPEKLVNMLYYVIGDGVLQDMMDDVDEFHANWGVVATEEVNTLILKAITGKEE